MKQRQLSRTRHGAGTQETEKAQEAAGLHKTRMPSPGLQSTFELCKRSQRKASKVNELGRVSVPNHPSNFPFLVMRHRCRHLVIVSA